MALLLKKEKHFCCVCMKLNEYEVIAENDEAVEFDLDTRPHGSQRYALMQSVHMCPYCGYANFDTDIEIEGIAVADIIKSHAFEQLADEKISIEAKKFRIAAFLYEKAGDFMTAGYLHLNCAWMLDDINNDADNIRRQAVLDFSKTEQTVEIAIIECDLMRRTGAFNDAAQLAKISLRSNGISQQHKNMLKQEITLCRQKRRDAVKYVEPQKSFIQKLLGK